MDMQMSANRMKAECQMDRHGPSRKNISTGANRKPNPRPAIRAKMGPIKGPKH